MREKWLRVAAFVHVFLFALVVGVFWGTWFSLSRSMRALTASTFLEVGHTMIGNLGGPMAVLMPATLSRQDRCCSCSIGGGDARACLWDSLERGCCWSRS
jgi:hypothetical protein